MLKSSFAEQVYKCCALIPKGRVSTYHNIATAMGKPRASRAVGNALNKNPYAPKVPCHRVVRSNGEVGGFTRGSSAKEKILIKEGIKIVDGKINLAKYLYEFKA